MAPSKGSSICKLMEVSPVTSTTTEAGASGSRVWSQPSSMRRSPLTLRSEIPICLSTSLPVQPVTEEPALPAAEITMKVKSSIEGEVYLPIIMLDIEGREVKMGVQRPSGPLRS